MTTRRTLRWGAVAITVLLLLPSSLAFASQVTQESETKRVEDVSGPSRSGYTAITTQEFSSTYPEAELIVLAPDGSTAYVDDRWSTYFDVDPVPDRPRTVEYVASEYLSESECNATTRCTREVFVRENFSTGESTVLWSRISPDKSSTRIHDIDRINETHIAVADIHTDSVFVYDLRRELQVWRWEAQRHFPLSSGGEFPDDWTHVNDVEVLSNGTLMVSLRNQDSVVFLARNGTVLSERTLGRDGDRDALYEQHNPDYLSGNPPTVLVSDSENDRVVEYERRDGDWRRTWGWRDEQLA